MISKELNDLLLRCQMHDEEAIEQCVLQNTRLVWSLVHRFHYTRYDPQDLFQIGCIGLMKAIMNYNPSFEVMFSTYAVPMILGEIKKFFREDGNMRISRSVKERYLWIIKYQETHLQQYHQEASIQQISKALNIEETDVIIALEANQHFLSLDEPYYQSDGSTIRLEDRLPTNKEFIIDYVSVRQELQKLTISEQQLLYYRYEMGFNQQEIALKMNMSQVQISRMEKKTILKLREKLV